MQREKPHRQGTESKAIEQLERNRSSFKYPDGGFVQKIEFSLVYAMLAAPETFPTAAMLAQIEETEFLQYIYTTEGDVSYAQLSAILAHAAETNPANKNTVARGEAEVDDDPIPSVSQKLVKKILKTVLQYAQEKDLDRETEVEDLLSPVKRVTHKRIENKSLKAILPFYLGYSAALLTANPLLLLVGVMGTAVAPHGEEEIANVEHIIMETDRASCVETAGLLDEEEDS